MLVRGRGCAVVRGAFAALPVLLLGWIGRVAAVLGRHLRGAVPRAGILALRVLFVAGRVIVLLAVLSGGLAVAMLLLLLLL